MLLFLALVLFLLFMGLGFLSHMLWLGLLASFLVLIGHMVRHGLAGRTPTSRLNVRLVRALSGFLDDVLETRAQEAERGTRAERVPELGPVTDEVTEAEVVEADESRETPRTAAATIRRPEARAEVRAAVAERAAHWRAMTPAKLEQAEEMAADGASRTEIARKLGVSRSTISRHLSGKVS